MANLIETTLDTLMIPGLSSRDASTELVAGINRDLDRSDDTTRLNQWRRGDRPIPQPVQDWMLRTCIAHAIRQAGGIPPGTDAELDALAKALCPPPR